MSLKKVFLTDWCIWILPLTTSGHDRVNLRGSITTGKLMMPAKQLQTNANKSVESSYYLSQSAMNRKKVVFGLSQVFSFPFFLLSQKGSFVVMDEWVTLSFFPSSYIHCVLENEVEMENRCSPFWPIPIILYMQPASQSDSPLLLLSIYAFTHESCTLK